MQTRSYRARWLFPVDAEPIENGTIAIDGDGRIAAVDSGHDPGAEDLGEVAVIPGLVNAHTHLEFSGLDSPLRPPTPFADWIRALMRFRRTRGAVRTEDILCGLREVAAAGTTLVGEIDTGNVWASRETCLQPEQRVIERAAGLATVVFRELIGVAPERIADQIAIARRHLASAGMQPDSQSPALSGRVIAGLSPHAPYSVHPRLFAKLVELAVAHHAPLAVHLAETREELELLDAGTGPLVEMLTEFGVWSGDVIPRGSRPLDYLRMLEPPERALVIHGNYLSDDEIDFLAGRENMTVVYCPRTHAYFGHAEHPWRELLRRGARIAVGTDSRASNPDLSLWNELRFLRNRYPDVAPRTLLELGTIAGARALGCERETGSLTVGKRADLAVVSLEPRGESDPYGTLFDEEVRIAGTMCGGLWIHHGF